jgi:hypothetical protein
MKIKKLGADYVVDALGMRSNTEIVEKIQIPHTRYLCGGRCGEVKNIRKRKISPHMTAAATFSFPSICCHR